MISKRSVTWCLAGILAVLGLLLDSCRKSASSFRTTPMNFSIPEGFPIPAYDFAAYPVTEEGFALGKALFHDNRLALHNDVNCGSCHQQIAAYTTFDHDLGHGTNHQHTTRNVPGIFNMAWHTEFSWDGRILSLHDQVLACITAPERMGETVGGLMSKLDTMSSYEPLFAAAFGDDEPSQDRISSALAQFVVMIVSADSKYDRVKRGEVQFNSSEAAGYSLFQSNCAGCHAEPLFTDFSYRNIGLPERAFHETDEGRMRVTQLPMDSLKFKVPALRNVGVTSYYAHDGRFAGISEILEHYHSGVQQSSTLDPMLTNGITLSNLERFYIQEFLLTLTDSSLINNQQFR